MKNFKKLTVWQRSMELAKAVSSIVERLPNEERYTYRDQLVRCSISIPSNIAEGSSRDSRKDFKRFLQIALGSSFELETQMLLLLENDYFTKSELEVVFSKNEEVQKMLQTLMKRLT